MEISDTNKIKIAISALEEIYNESQKLYFGNNSENIKHKALFALKILKNEST